MVRLYSPFLESVDSCQFDGNLQQNQEACGHFDLIISAMTKRWKNDSHRANLKKNNDFYKTSSCVAVNPTKEVYAPAAPGLTISLES